MKTKIVKVSSKTKDAKIFDEAGRLIRAGELVAFPTETVYGLGANGLDAAACRKIYEAKGRPSDNPLILHVADRAMIDMIAADVSPLAEKLIASFCPGPITIIMPKKPCVPDSVTGGLGTVGIRMPDSDVCRALIAAAGVPIAAPSANISGRPSPTTAEMVARDMDGRIPLILDAGPCEFGVESTIVACDADDKITILRPGAITREMLPEITSDVELDPAIKGTMTDSDAHPRAPGMKYRHYAPKAPLALIEPKNLTAKNVAAMLIREISAAKSQDKKIGLIVSDETTKIIEEKNIVPKEYIKSYGHQCDLKAIAANIYRLLRSFDDTDRTQLYAEATTRDGLGLAIMNRLTKSSGGNIITE